LKNQRFAARTPGKHNDGAVEMTVARSPTVEASKSLHPQGGDADNDGNQTERFGGGTSMSQDEEHLGLLSIFHYVVGGITAFAACLPCIHLGLGIALVSGVFPAKPGQQGIHIFIGWFLIVLASMLILAGWALAVAIVVTGRFLARRTNYMRCFVVAAVECILFPFGTVLGVFTIIVLSRPSVRVLFQSQIASPDPP
jgi:hypothetical protein